VLTFFLKLIIIFVAMDKKELTAADIWAMFAETVKQFDKTDKQLDKTARILEETAILSKKNEEKIAELRESQKETDRLSKKTDEKLDKLCGKVGGIEDNQGHHAEQFFQGVFEKKLEFGRIKYDEMIPNLKHKSNKGEIEFDIALVNGDSIALIEVKNRIHPNFVNELAEKRIEKFREYFREFDKYNVYLGIAGFSFSEEVLDRASAYGVGIVKQAGDGVEISADNLRAY